MRENALRKLWSQGGTAVNGWLGIPSGYSAEVMAHLGWDSLTIDMQHGLVEYQAAVSMLQGISTTDTVPMARVPWLDPGIIMKMLDAGCYGIICPMVNSRADAEAFVGACRYAPQGHRSFGPARATLYGGEDYFTHANETVLALAMIESRRALENLDDILSTPGLDGIYIGPADLSVSLGYEPSLSPNEPRVMEAIESILAAARRHGVIPGIHCGSAERAARMARLGFRLVTILGDARLMAMAASQALHEARGKMGEGTGSASKGRSQLDRRPCVSPGHDRALCRYRARTGATFMIVIEGTITVPDLDKARPHMQAMIEASRAEPGCIDYGYAIDLLDPTLVRINERWESREALARHAASHHIKAWRAVWPEIGIGNRALRLYEAEPEAC